MKRLFSCSALLLCAVVLAPVLHADVKTVQKTTFKLEGLLGAFLNRAAGGDDGLTATTAIKGNRMSRTTGTHLGLHCRPGPAHGRSHRMERKGAGGLEPAGPVAARRGAHLSGGAGL
jgi:hypothetical protein